ncbi:MAG: DUF2203 domain-containing protein [Chloroflexi bacterium]|nr:DUF2203 domain-containing protein [Chloroflexota bacterium]MBI3734749.1 DUF2203 domain-containing protein [Chloroflexota bacterium]
MPRHFTVSEANALLPTLKQLLEAMLAARQRIIDQRKTWEPLIEKAGGNGGGPRGKRLYLDSEQIRRALEQINEWGILIKDLDTGLVDFPHLREGREVYLCWRLGEAEVAYWHEVDSGFSSRQPL